MRNPFPGNIIPQAGFDPVAVKIQALIPLPDFAGNINNWNQAPKYNKISATPAIKIDHNFSAAQQDFVLSATRTGVTPSPTDRTDCRFR